MGVDRSPAAGDVCAAAAADAFCKPAASICRGSALGWRMGDAEFGEHGEEMIGVLAARIVSVLQPAGHSVVAGVRAALDRPQNRQRG